MPAKRKLRAPDGVVLAMSAGDRALVTSETVMEMERWAKHDQDHPKVRALAVEAALRSGDGRNPGRPFCHVLEELIRQRVQYVQGPLNVQLLHQPGVLLSLSPPAGNCVDMSTLSAACCMAVGLSPRFLRLAFSPHGPDPYEHVVVACDVLRPDGSEERCVLDSTLPAGQTAAMLARAVRSALHEPIGRPEVSALHASEVGQEALTVYQEATPMGQPTPPARLSTNRRCPCGSSRLAGACCGAEGEPDEPRLVAELRLALSGNTDLLSDRFGAFVDMADAVIVQCHEPTARQDERFTWIPGARQAAYATAEAARSMEAFGDSILVSPEALYRAAAYIAGQIGEIESFVEWLSAATEALSIASSTCAQGEALSGGMSWGKRYPLGRAGGLGAEEALGAKIARALFPANAQARGAATPILNTFGAGLCHMADFAPVADALNGALQILGASVSAKAIENACAAAASGGAPVQGSDKGTEIQAAHVPQSIRYLLSDRAAGFDPNAGPFEGEWTLVTNRGDTIVVRLYDRLAAEDGGAWVVGPVVSVSGPGAFRGDFAGRRDHNVTDGRFHSYGNDRNTGWILSLNADGSLQGYTPRTDATLVGTRAGGGIFVPPAAPSAPSKNGLPGWLVAAAAAAVALVASK